MYRNIITGLRVSAAAERGNRPLQQDNLRLSDVVPYLPPNADSFEMTRSLDIGTGQVFAVADGLGGEGGHGQLASFQALQALHWRLEAEEEEPCPPEQLLYEAVETANDAVCDLGQCLGLVCQAPYTTVSCVYLDRSGQVVTAGVGDSPIYLLRDGAATLINTLDQSAAAQNVITAALGEQYHNIHIRRMQLCPGDSILLTTDGLFHAYGPERLPELLEEKTIRELVREAVKPRRFRKPLSPDNVTAMLIRTVWGSEEEPEELPDEEAGEEIPPLTLPEEPDEEAPALLEEPDEDGPEDAVADSAAPENGPAAHPQPQTEAAPQKEE